MFKFAFVFVMFEICDLGYGKGNCNYMVCIDLSLHFGIRIGVDLCIRLHLGLDHCLHMRNFICSCSYSISHNRIFIFVFLIEFGFELHLCFEFAF